MLTEAGNIYVIIHSETSHLISQSEMPIRKEEVPAPIVTQNALEFTLNGRDVTFLSTEALCSK